MITVAAAEINATRHCVNRCANCNHASAFATPYEMDPEVLRRDLAALKGILHVNFFCIQGGEPMLHTRLMDIMRVLVESGVCGQPAILTNARLSLRMPEGFWAYLGQHGFEFRVSAYPNVEPAIQPYVEGKARIYRFSVRWQIINSFLKVFTEQANPQYIYSICPWRRCLTVHEGFFYLCPLTTFWPSEFMNLPATIDGIPLDGITESGLAAFLARDKHLESCRICTGASAERVPWHENNNREEWLREAGL